MKKLSTLCCSSKYRRWCKYVYALKSAFSKRNDWLNRWLSKKSLLKEALIRTLKSALTSQLSMSWQSRRSDSFKPPARKKLRRKTFFQTGEKRKCFLEPKTTFDVKLEKTVFRQNWRFRTKKCRVMSTQATNFVAKIFIFHYFTVGFSTLVSLTSSPQLLHSIRFKK